MTKLDKNTSEKATMTRVWGASSVSKVDVTQDARYRWFVDRQDDLRGKGEIVELKNPLPALAEKVGEFGIFTFFRCSETGFQFANPRLSTAGTLRHFAENDYGEYFATVESTKATRIEIAYRPLLQYLMEHRKAPASLLEVGCGSGALLEFLRDEGGYDVEGVEIAPTAVPYQQKKHLKVYQAPIEALKPARQFDIVLMWSVLDHLADPVAALQTSYRALKPGGLMLIGNVNTDGFDHQIMGHDNFTFRPPGRVNYYNIKSLTAHIELSGFEVLEVTTPGKLDVDLVRDYWRESADRPRVPFLETLLLDSRNKEAAAEFQEFLGRRQLSGYQRVLARKPLA